MDKKYILGIYVLWTDADNASKLCTENDGQIEIVEKCRACSDFKMVTSDIFTIPIIL